MLQVISLGEVLLVPGFSGMAQGKKLVYPLGYVVKRPVFDDGDATKIAKGDDMIRLPSTESSSQRSGKKKSPSPCRSDLYFTIAVEADSTKAFPLFRITRSDTGPSKEYVSEKLPNKALREALEDVERDFPQRKSAIACPKDSKGNFLIYPFRMMGLSLLAVRSAITALPNGAEALDSGKKSATPVPKGKAKEKEAKKKEEKTAVAAPCPDCGLAGTPFCAATGKPHLPPPCPQCGLTSTYCPITGLAHEGVAVRSGRKRGEVRLPRKVSKPRAGRIAAVTQGVVSEVVEVHSQPRQPERKRDRSEASDKLKEAPKRRRQGAGETASKETEKAKATEQVPLAELFQPPESRPPRPTLAYAEQVKAAAALQVKLNSRAMDAGDGPYYPPPFANELHLSLIPAPKRIPGRRGKTTKREDGEGEGGGAPSPAAAVAAQRTLIHPLEVLVDSTAAKRYTKFMIQYASERSKLEALRSSVVPAGSKTKLLGIDNASAPASEVSPSMEVKLEEKS